MARFNLDPTGSEGGGGALPFATPPVAATATAPVTAPPVAPPASISAEALAELSRLREFETRIKDKEAADEATRKAKELKSLEEKGEWEKINNQHKADNAKLIEDLAAERVASQKSLTQATLSAALAGKNLTEHAPKHLLKLWSDDFEAVKAQDGSTAIREKGTGLSVEESVSRRLASGEYNPFLKATTTGGSGASGGSGALPTPPQTPAAAPKNLGESLLWRAASLRGVAPEQVTAGFRPMSGFNFNPGSN